MASSVPEEKKVKRIVKVLKQIAENLNQDEIIELRTSIRNAIELKKDYDEIKVRKLLEMCVEKLRFRPGISGNLMKQSMRSFLMILKNEQLGKIVYEKFTHYILREHSSIAIGMEWDDELLKAYFKALEKGHESAHHARFMVVGMYKAGKTTLVSKLLEKPEPPPDSSTVFIDISVDTCEVDGDGKWKETAFEEKERRYRVRLQDLFNSNEGKYEKNAEMDISDGRSPEQEHMEDTDGAQGDMVKYDMHEQRMNIFKKEELNQTSETVRNIKKAKDNVKKHADLEKRPPTVAIWDFAGQSVYYSTHQFFLNPRTIYLLVLNLSKELNDKVDEGEDSKGATNLYIGTSNTARIDFTQQEAFQFWMRSIYIYTKQKDTQMRYKPTIVLVGTNKDGRGYDGEEADIFAEDYFNKALKPFKGRPVMGLIYKKKFFVSKYDSSDVFDSLRAELNTIATKQLFWEEQIPARFIPLEREVEKRKSKEEEILQFNELKTVSAKSHYPLTDEQIRVFLGFQHAFGNMLYYHKANPDMIILHPKWIINALKIFVTHRNRPQSEEWTKFTEDEWEQFTEIGKLSETLIDELLQAGNADFLQFKDEIVRYMEHLDIIAKPVKDTEYTKETHEPQDTNVWRVKINHSKDMTNADFYLMPLRFPRRPSKEEIKVMLGCTDGNTWISSPVLCMYIKGAFLPPFVFHRILATCIKDMPVAKHEEKDVLFNGFGAFQIDASTKLTTWSWDDMIYVKVTSYHVYRKPGMNAADLQEVRMDFEKLVRRAFDTDVSGHGEKMEISYYVTCPRCREHFPFDKKEDKEGFPIDQKIGLLLVENLRIVKGASCSSKQHYVDSCDALKNWFRDDIKTTKNVDPRLIESAPDERFLADLSNEIEVKKLHELADMLGISNKLDRIKEDHRTCALNVTFHILYEWKKMGESLAILLPPVKAAGCKEEDFYRILKGIDNDLTKRTLNNIRQKLSPNKLENITLDNAECLTIAKCIGKVYWLLGIQLGVPEHVIQRLDMEYKYCTEKITHIILLKWLRKPRGKTNREINEELIRAMVKSSSEMDGVIKIFGK